MDFDRVAWFVGGVLVGNMLDRVTTFILLLCWALVVNKQLPEGLGGHFPQQVFFSICNSALNLVVSPITKIRNYRKKQEAIENTPEFVPILRQIPINVPIHIPIRIPTLNSEN